MRKQLHIQQLKRSRKLIHQLVGPAGDIVCLFAYDMYEEENVFDAAYNLCIQDSKNSYEKVLVNDRMTGGVSYGLSLGYEGTFNSNHTSKPRDNEDNYTVTLKCNYFYFEGLVDSGFDGVHAAEH